MVETSDMKELNQHGFYQLKKQEGNDKFLKSALTNWGKYWHSVNLFYCKTYARGVFRTRSNIYTKLSCDFLQRISTINVPLGSKYTCIDLHTAQSLEIICILNIFAAKYIFLTKEEWHKEPVSKLKEIS